MVRAVLVVVATIFSVTIALFVGGVALEPIAEHVKTYDSIDEGDLNGTDVINDVLTLLLQFAGVIVIGGIILWAVARQYLKERVPRGPGGGGGL